MSHLIGLLGLVLLHVDSLIVASLIGSVSIEMQIFHGQKATSRKDLDASIQALKPSHIHAQNPSVGIQQPKGMISSF